MKFVQGIKVGVYSGVVISVISLPINYYLLAIKYRDELSFALKRPYHPGCKGFLLLFILTTLVFAACGVLYVVFYDKLPFENPFWKAFVFGAAIYVISRIGDFITDYPLSPGLALENALWSAPLNLILWPYLVSKLYQER